MFIYLPFPFRLIVARGLGITVASMQPETPVYSGDAAIVKILRKRRESTAKNYIKKLVRLPHHFVMRV